jgi:hypothetical protein
MCWRMKSSNVSTAAQHGARRAVCQSTLRLTTRRSRCSVRQHTSAVAHAIRGTATRSVCKVSTASLRTRCCTASFLHAVLCVQRRDAGGGCPPSSRGARLDVGVKRRDRRRDRGLALARGRRRHSPSQPARGARATCCAPTARPTSVFVTPTRCQARHHSAHPGRVVHPRAINAHIDELGVELTADRPQLGSLPGCPT